MCVHYVEAVGDPDVDTEDAEDDASGKEVDGRLKYDGVTVGRGYAGPTGRRSFSAVWIFKIYSVFRT